MPVTDTILRPAKVTLLARESGMEPILKTENLWKVYHAGRVKAAALQGVNFSVLPGKFVSVMGPSGCGKSTLLYVIGGLARATRGKVLVDGNDLAAMSDAERTLLRRHKIGFVFQRFNLLPTLDAYGNIAIAQHIHGNGFDPHRFEVVTKMLGLATLCITALRKCPAVNSSVWLSRARSSTSRKFCSRMSQLEI